MKKPIIVLVVGIIILRFLWLGRPSVEYDEGWYLNTLLTVSRGNPLYEKTFLSQPPGFFLLTYPGFLLLGKSLQAVRLSIFLLSLLGVTGILWLAKRSGNVLIGALTIGILFLIPRYYQEIVTFHADALPLTFSTLSLASMMSFYKNHKARWFLLAVGLWTIAFWIKFDVTALPALIYILYSKITRTSLSFRKIAWLLVGLLAIVSALSYAFLKPFDIKYFYLDVMQYRMQAALYYGLSVGRIFIFLFKDTSLFILIMMVTFLVAIKMKNNRHRFLFNTFSLWSYTSLFSILLYRPLAPHHLFILTIPFAFFFSYLVFTYWQKSAIRLLAVVLVIVLAFQILNLFMVPKITGEDTRTTAIRAILTNTKKTDYIISDDGLLPALTGRLTPPGLVDLSEVRIESHNLTPNMFETNLVTYRPKLIIFWAARLEQLTGIDNILKKYHYALLSELDRKHRVYLLIK